MARQLNQHPLLGLSMALGQSTVNLRQSLEHLTRESPAGWPALFGGLEPYPDGWRASVQARSVAALSDGSAPRRLPRWQLISKTNLNRTATVSESVVAQIRSPHSSARFI